jgi:hypothetical protein
MTVYFIVRAKVDDAAVRGDFDRWYRDEHLTDAARTFSALRAWRGWSEVDPSLHYAFYEFDDVAKARAIPGSEGFRRLVADFDRAWGDSIQRSRDIVELVQAIGP